MAYARVMGKFFVSGLTNIETTCRVGGFPIAYAPCHYPFHGVHATVSGVGINVTYALAALGDEVRSASIVGRDFLAEWVRADFARRGVSDAWLAPLLAETPQSVILYDGDGRRQINVDLKEVQETDYPEERFRDGIAGCDAAVLCNINFSRRFLTQARASGVRVATDVHCVSDLHDAYNADFMRGAHVLFMSDEHMDDPAEFTRAVAAEYGNDIVVTGLGGDGALLHVKGGGITHHPAVATRPIVNTIGAGDALFSAFLHYFVKGEGPQQALRKAMYFASHKIGAKGAAEGFLGESELEALFAPVA